MKDQARWDQETDRILLLLKAVQRILGFTNRDLEKRLGLSFGYLSRLFNRKIAFRFDHVVAIVAVMGLRFDEFFRAVYPRTMGEPSPAARRIRAVFPLGESEEPDRSTQSGVPNSMHEEP